MFNIVLSVVMVAVLILMVYNIVLKLSGSHSAWYVDPRIKPISITIIVICNLLALVLLIAAIINSDAQMYLLAAIWAVNGWCWLDDAKS